MKNLLLNALQWIAIPFIFFITLIVVTGVINFFWRFINPESIFNKTIAEMGACGIASYFSLDWSFSISPKKNINTLYVICLFAVLFYGMAIGNSIMKREFFDLWGEAANIVGFSIAFYKCKEELD
ncbi:MAG: hypothetical protein WCP85_12655 [Mariniphaga sp.]